MERKNVIAAVVVVMGIVVWRMGAMQRPVVKNAWKDQHTLWHSNVINSVSFSSDGNRVVTASKDGTTKIWDVKSGGLLHSLEGDDGNVKSASFSPDGNRVVTAPSDGRAKIWNANNGKLVHTLWDTTVVNSASFSSDGNRVVTACKDATAKIWDANSGALLHTLEGDDRDVTSASFSPDGNRVVTASSDGRAHIWQLISNID